MVCVKNLLILDNKEIYAKINEDGCVYSENESGLNPILKVKY